MPRVSHLTLSYKNSNYISLLGLFIKPTRNLNRKVNGCLQFNNLSTKRRYTPQVTCFLAQARCGTMHLQRKVWHQNPPHRLRRTSPPRYIPRHARNPPRRQSPARPCEGSITTHFFSNKEI